MTADRRLANNLLYGCKNLALDATHCFITTCENRSARFLFSLDSHYNAVYVGRPSKWGNPYKPSEFSDPGGAVLAFRVLMESEPENIAMIKSELKGRMLSCFCPLDKPCHADVLAEIANGYET